MNIRIPLNEFQKSLYQLLSKGQSVPVYDRIPDEQIKLPYIWLGMMQDIPIDENKTFFTHSITQYIHVFSNSQGKKEMSDIMNDIIYLISTYDLPMEHNHLIESELSTVTANGEEYQEGMTGYHGIIVYKFKIQQED